MAQCIKPCCCRNLGGAVIVNWGSIMANEGISTLPFSSILMSFLVSVMIDVEMPPMVANPTTEKM